MRSLLRTSLRGLNVVVRRGLLSRFFATVEVAAGFVGEHSKADAQQLRDAICAHRPSRVPPPRPSISL